MVMHVRKTLSRKEVKEFEAWKADHDAAIKKAELSKSEKEAKRQSYWKQQSALVSNRINSRGDYKAIPSLPPQKDVIVKKDVLLDMEPEEREEYLRREEIAQREINEKKNRVAPTYNKGGNQYWSDGMIDDLKTGGHRRR